MDSKTTKDLEKYTLGFKDAKEGVFDANYLKDKAYSQGHEDSIQDEFEKESKGY